MDIGFFFKIFWVLFFGQATHAIHAPVEATATEKIVFAKDMTLFVQGDEAMSEQVIAICLQHDIKAEIRKEGVNEDGIVKARIDFTNLAFVTRNKIMERMQGLLFQGAGFYWKD